MEGVCLNPNDVLRCRSSLSDFATLPDKPSWCVPKEPERERNLLALWIILALLLPIAFAVCCFLCYRYKRKIRRWTLINWIIHRIDNIRTGTDSTDAPKLHQNIPLDKGKESKDDNIAPEKGDKKETSPMLPKKDISENSPTPV